MVEEILGIFSARQSMPEEDGGRSCTLFLTSGRVIVMKHRGIDPRTVALPIIALAVGFTGFLLMNFVLFFIGAGMGIVASLVLGLADFLIRRRRISKAKKLAPDEILKADRRNFEIPYAKIAKIETKRFEEFRRASMLLPTFQEYKWAVKFFAENRSYIFSLDSDVYDPFIERIRPFVSQIVETE